MKKHFAILASIIILVLFLFRRDDFEIVHVAKFSEIQSPCIPIKIENKEFIVELDTGYNGHLSLSKEILESLKNKKFRSFKKVVGFRGHSYKAKSYTIPEITIGSKIFSDLVVTEEVEEFNKDSIIDFQNNTDIQFELGSLGWKVFKKTNLFLNLGNEEIGLCKHARSVERLGYNLREFSCVPLFLDRGLIEFDAMKDGKNLRCILDTGFTNNVLNNPNKSVDIDRIYENPSSRIDVSLFEIGNDPFCPGSFLHMPLNFPLEIEAVLGMDFCRSHLIFIDFENKKIYFSS